MAIIDWTFPGRIADLHDCSVISLLSETSQCGVSVQHCKVQLLNQLLSCLKRPLDKGLHDSALEAEMSSHLFTTHFNMHGMPVISIMVQ